MLAKLYLSYTPLLDLAHQPTNDAQSFEHCTQPLGPLRQSVFSCITCNPPPSSNSDSYTPAGLCYACSIACHGEHTLVELFTRRDFTCDCGTIRLPAKAPCTLRINPSSGMKGPVHSQEPPQNNNYNHNFQNTFCGCGEVYDAHKEKGTMYQCIGLATEQDGGCGEDWWHPECLLGLPRDWYTTIKEEAEAESHSKPLSTRSNEVEQEAEHPVPPGFPDDDQFEALICYKCVNTSPWIKRYAGSNGFEAVVKQSNNASEAKDEMDDSTEAVATPSDQAPNPVSQFKKRKAADTDSGSDPASPKRAKISSGEDRPQEPLQAGTCRIASLPLEPKGTFSLVATTEKFRERFCRCPDCYTLLKTHPQLLEEEDIYEPPISEEGDNANGGGSVGTGSLLDRGEAALSNMDRVRAIGT